MLVGGGSPFSSQSPGRADAVRLWPPFCLCTAFPWALLQLEGGALCGACLVQSPPLTWTGGHLKPHPDLVPHANTPAPPGGEHLGPQSYGAWRAHVPRTPSTREGAVWEPEATPVSPQVTHWLPWGPAAAIWVLGERKLSREDRHSHRYIRVPGALGHIHKCYSKTQYKCTGGKKTGRKYSEMLTVVTSCGF